MSPFFFFNSDCRWFWNLKTPHSGHSPGVLRGFGVYGNSEMSEVTLKTMCLSCERTRDRQEEEILQGRRYRGPKGSVAAVFRVTGKPLMYLFSCGLELVLATTEHSLVPHLAFILCFLKRDSTKLSSGLTLYGVNCEGSDSIRVVPPPSWCQTEWGEPAELFFSHGAYPPLKTGPVSCCWLTRKAELGGWSEV